MSDVPNQDNTGTVAESQNSSVPRINLLKRMPQPPSAWARLKKALKLQEAFKWMNRPVVEVTLANPEVRQEPALVAGFGETAGAQPPQAQPGTQQPAAAVTEDFRTLLARAFGQDSVEDSTFEKVKNSTVVQADPLIAQIPGNDGYQLAIGRTPSGQHTVSGLSPLTPERAVWSVNYAMNSQKLRTQGVYIFGGTEEDHAFQILAAAAAQPTLVINNPPVVSAEVMARARAAFEQVYPAAPSPTPASEPVVAPQPLAAAAAVERPIDSPASVQTAPQAQSPVQDMTRELRIDPAVITLEERAKAAYESCFLTLTDTRVKLTGDVIDRMMMLKAASYFNFKIDGMSIPTAAEMEASGKITAVNNAWDDHIQGLMGNRPPTPPAPVDLDLNNLVASTFDPAFLRHLQSKAAGTFAGVTAPSPLTNPADIPVPAPSFAAPQQPASHEPEPLQPA